MRFTSYIPFIFLTAQFAYSQPNEKLLIKKTDKLIKSIKKQKDNLDPLMLPFINYIQKKYKIQFEINPQKIIEKYSDDAFGEYWKSFSTGMFGISPLCADTSLNGVNAVYSRLYLCKFCPTTQQDINLINKWYMDKKGYGITHAYFLSKLIYENGCENLQSTNLRQIIDEAPTYFIYADEYFEPCEDVYIEIATMLAISKKFPNNLAQMVDKIAEYQLKNGGFSGVCDKQKDQFNAHTSILALLLFLEYLYPNTDEVCWFDF